MRGLHCQPKGLVHFRALFCLSFTCVAALSLAAPDWYYRSGIPDYDQRRDPLPGNGGMYCVPTSYTDILKYISAHGIPGMDGGFGDSYDDVTQMIALVGAAMYCSATDGTNGYNAWLAMKSWIDVKSPYLIVQLRYGPDWTWGKATIRNCIASGAINTIGYGRYHVESGKMRRDGGHEVVLTGYDWTVPSDPLFIVKDPWTDGDLDSQSTFLDEGKYTKNDTYVRAGTDESVTHARYTLWQGSGDDYGKKAKIIDGMHVICPMYAGWFDATVYSGNGGPLPMPLPLAPIQTAAGFQARLPWQFSGETDQVPSAHTFVPVGKIVDWSWDIGQLAVLYLNDSGGLYLYDLTSGRSRLLRIMPGAFKLVVGGTSLDLFVVANSNGGAKLIRLERDDLPMEDGMGRNVQRTQSVNLPGSVSAMDIDPSTGAVSVLSSDMRTLRTYDDRLSLVDVTNLPAVPGNGVPLLSLDPDTGEVVLARKGGTSFVSVVRGPGTAGPRTSPFFINGIDTLQCTNNGLTMVQSAGRLGTYSHSGYEVTTQFTNMICDGSVRLTRSHFAAKASTFDEPGWQNIDPDLP